MTLPRYHCGIGAAAFDPGRSRLWLATKAGLLAIDEAGETALSVTRHPSTQFQDLAFDPHLDTLWAATQKAVERYDTAGRLLLAAPQIPMTRLSMTLPIIATVVN